MIHTHIDKNSYSSPSLLTTLTFPPFFPFPSHLLLVISSQNAIGGINRPFLLFYISFTLFTFPSASCWILFLLLHWLPCYFYRCVIDDKNSKEASEVTEIKSSRICNNKWYKIQYKLNPAGFATTNDTKFNTNFLSIFQ